MTSIPNGFAPSPLAQGADYDHEARLIETKPFDPNFDEEPELASRQSMYQTLAQDPNSIAPHLKAAIVRDRPRRNYSVEAGGSVVYHNDSIPAGVASLPSYDAPTRQESLGHNSLDATKFGGH